MKKDSQERLWQKQNESLVNEWMKTIVNEYKKLVSQL